MNRTTVQQEDCSSHPHPLEGGFLCHQGEIFFNLNSLDPAWQSHFETEQKTQPAFGQRWVDARDVLAYDNKLKLVETRKDLAFYEEHGYDREDPSKRNADWMERDAWMRYDALRINLLELFDEIESLYP